MSSIYTRMGNDTEKTYTYVRQGERVQGLH